MPPRDILLAVLVAFVYGVAFVAIRHGVDEFPPLMLTGYRFLLAAVPLVFFVKPPSIGAGWIIGYGVMQAVIMFGLIFTAIAWGMPAGLASLLAQVQVFFTIAFSALLFGERPTRMQIGGAIIALAGITVIGWSRAQYAPVLPFLMTIASAAAWGAANVISKAAKPDRMLGFIVWASLAAPVPLFALSALFEGTIFAVPPAGVTWIGWGSVAFLAWPTTIFAFTAWVWLLKQHPAATVTPFALLIPVFGMGSTALAFGERLASATIIGAVIVFVGLAINMFGNRLFSQHA